MINQPESAGEVVVPQRPVDAIRIKRRKHKKLMSIASLVISAVASAALIYAIFQQHGFGDFLAMIHGVDRTGVAIYFVLSACALCLRTLRYRWIFSGISTSPFRISFNKLLIVTVIRNALSDFLPARLGEISFLYTASAFGVPMLAAATTFGISLALDILALLFLISIAAALAPFMIRSQDPSFALFATLQDHHLYLVSSAFFVVSTAAIIAVINKADVLASGFANALDSFASHNFEKKPRIRNALFSAACLTKDFGSELVTLRRQGRIWSLIASTLVMRVMKYFSLYILLLAVVGQWGVGRHDISPVLSTVAFICAEASASLPASGIMGFGAYEGAWSVIFSLSHTQIPNVPSVILVVHLITQVVGYSYGLIGAFFFAAFQLRAKREIDGAQTSIKISQIAD